jgi:hypothetical protein
LPTGDSLESFFSDGLASAEPTIVYLSLSPVFSSLMFTVTPTLTTSVDSSEVSTTCAERRRSSSWAIFCSSIICSFLASSYSEFSVMSPNSRASLMRSATSRRFVVCRSSSSRWSVSRPWGVRMTSLGMGVRGGWVGSRPRHETPLSGGESAGATWLDERRSIAPC